MTNFCQQKRRCQFSAMPVQLCDINLFKVKLNTLKQTILLLCDHLKRVYKIPSDNPIRVKQSVKMFNLTMNKFANALIVESSSTL